MKAILLSAGLGTRLRPLTNSVPKCLVPINGRPLMDYWMHGLFASGVDRVLVNLHYLPAAVLEYIAGSEFSDRIDTVMENDLLGTAGTLKANQNYLKDGAFFVAHADNFCVSNIRDFISAHQARRKGVLATMMTFVADEPSECGIVELDDFGHVLAFHEKKPDPPGNLANGAVYVLEPQIFDIINSLENKEILDISLDVIPKILPEIATWQNRECHIDVGTIERYEQANLAAQYYRGRMREMKWF